MVHQVRGGLLRVGSLLPHVSLRDGLGSLGLVAGAFACWLSQKPHRQLLKKVTNVGLGCVAI